MPEEKTTIYVNMGSGRQVKVEMTHETEGLPTPHELPAVRPLFANEMDGVLTKLGEKSFFHKPLF